MTNVYDNLGLKNMSDPILKQIYGIYKAKHFIKEKLKNTKRLNEKFLKNWRSK